MEAMDLTYSALLRYITRRTEKSALFGLSLLVHEPTFTTWADALGGNMFRRLLGLVRPICRAALLQEHRQTSRMSTDGWIDAIMVLSRVEAYEKYRTVQQV